MSDPTPPQRSRFPIIGVLGMANAAVCALCLTAAYIVRQWRLVRQAEIDANERVALMTRGKGGKVTSIRRNG
jgi:hypothetical protein